MARATAYLHAAPKEPEKIDWAITGWFTLLHAIGLIAPFFFFSWSAVAVAFVLYILTGMFGITLGYHRLLTHRSFRAPKWVERTLATFGVLALQRSPVEWVGDHRMHHSFVDTGKDPHNAHRGFWYSHIGWMCVRSSSWRGLDVKRRFARDIAADPYLNWLTGEWPQILLQVALGVLLLAVGGLPFVVWGVFVRVMVLYHATWFVNSATHKWGYRNYDTKDLSSNCWWVSLIAFGEGWHNNHHAFPDMAPAGHRFFEIDATWYVIKLMQALGLATEVRVPPKRVEFAVPIGGAKDRIVL